MSEYLQENRRAVVMLAVVLCVAVLAGLYWVLSGGADAEELAPVTRGAAPDPVVTEEAVADVQPAVRVYAGRGTNANPFGPLAGSQDDASKSSDSQSTGSKSTGSKSTSSPKTTSSTTKSNTSSDPSGTNSSRSGTDPAPKPVKKSTPQPVRPEPIDTGKDAQEAVLVRIVEIQDESVVARVDGKRSTVYLNEPGDQGVVYVAPLGSGCAWMGRTGSEIRVSVCKGKAERV